MKYIIMLGLAVLWFLIDQGIQTLIGSTIEGDLRSGWHFSEEFLINEVQDTKNCGYIMRAVWLLGIAVMEALTWFRL